jgi:hypothetical protein
MTLEEGLRMFDDANKTIVEKILSNFPTCLALLGVVLVVLGLAGGVKYNGFLPIPDTEGRVAAGFFGALLVAIGVALYRSQSKRLVNPRIARSDIKITSPREGEEVNTVDVHGVIEAPIPDGYSLCIFRIYPGSDRMIPIGKAIVDISMKTWVADHCHAGGRTGERRFIGVFLVGSAGAALIDYYNDANRVHRKMIDQLRATGAEVEYLPTLSVNLPNSFECHRVGIKTKRS